MTTKKTSYAERRAAGIAARKAAAMNAEAYLGGIGERVAIFARVEVSALNVRERRELFSALIRDEQVVTAKQFSDEHIALWQAIEKACKWEGGRA